MASPLAAGLTGAPVTTLAAARNPSSTIARVLPLAFILLYLNASVLVFLTGPWRWPLGDATRLYTFFFAAHTAIAVGYLSAIRQPARPYLERWPLTAIVWVPVALTLLLFVPTIAWLTQGGVDLNTVLEPGLAYRHFQDIAILERPTQPVSYVRTLLGPILSLVTPLVVFYWEKLSRWLRLLGVLAILANLAQFIVTGRNRGLLDLLLLVPMLAGLRIGAGKLRISLGGVFRTTAIASVIASAFFVFYTASSVQRTGGKDSSDYVPILNGMYSDESNWMLRDTPVAARAMIRSLTFNQTHGYFALYMALDMPFESAFPVGHSYALQRQEQRLFHSTELTDRSYTARLHKAGLWHESVFWHTTYLWFASDISFPGVVLLLFVFGRLIARSWIDSIESLNPFAVSMFVLLATIVCYLPTNNIMFGFPEAYTSFWGTMVLWLSSRGRLPT